MILNLFISSSSGQGPTLSSSLLSRDSLTAGGTWNYRLFNFLNPESLSHCLMTDNQWPVAMVVTHQNCSICLLQRELLPMLPFLYVVWIYRTEYLLEYTSYVFCRPFLYNAAVYFPPTCFLVLVRSQSFGATCGPEWDVRVGVKFNFFHFPFPTSRAGIDWR